MCNKKCTVENRDDEFDFFFSFLIFFPLERWGSLISLLFCVEWREGGREGGNTHFLKKLTAGCRAW